MQNDYISRGEFIKAVCKDCGMEADVSPCDLDECYIRNKLLGLPAAYVRPVVRGEWISFLDGESIMPERYYRCSRCGRIEKRREPFCHCGADMRGESNG